MMADTERDGLELEKHRREIASIVFKSETLEEISAQWNWRDGDPTTPEGAHTFAARIKAATGRDVRAMFLRNDGDNGVVFAVHDIDLNAATERKERNLDAYRETYAKATAAGITDAAKPADVAFALPIDGSFMFPHNVAEEADNIEKHNRNLLAEIEKRTMDAERRKADDEKRAAEIDTAANKRAGEIIAAAIIPTGAARTYAPAQTRPGRYRHNANVGGISQKEAAEILTRLNVPTTERTIRRWLTGETKPPPDFPGLSDRQTFLTWAFAYSQRGDMAIQMKNHLPLKETATESANMKRTGRSQPRGIW